MTFISLNIKTQKPEREKNEKMSFLTATASEQASELAGRRQHGMVSDIKKKCNKFDAVRTGVHKNSSKESSVAKMNKVSDEQIDNGQRSWGRSKPVWQVA